MVNKQNNTTVISHPDPHDVFIYSLALRNSIRSKKESNIEEFSSDHKNITASNPNIFHPPPKLAPLPPRIITSPHFSQTSNQFTSRSPKSPISHSRSCTIPSQSLTSKPPTKINSSHTPQSTIRARTELGPLHVRLPLTHESPTHPNPPHSFRRIQDSHHSNPPTDAPPRAGPSHSASQTLPAHPHHTPRITMPDIGGTTHAETEQEYCAHRAAAARDCTSTTASNQGGLSGSVCGSISLLLRERVCSAAHDECSGTPFASNAPKDAAPGHRPSHVDVDLLVLALRAARDAKGAMLLYRRLDPRRCHAGERFVDLPLLFDCDAGGDTVGVGTTRDPPGPNRSLSVPESSSRQSLSFERNQLPVLAGRSKSTKEFHGSKKDMLQPNHGNAYATSPCEGFVLERVIANMFMPNAPIDSQRILKQATLHHSIPRPIETLAELITGPFLPEQTRKNLSRSLQCGM